MHLSWSTTWKRLLIKPTMWTIFLEQELPYAFDEEFGYLTSCPSNTGTGMRASVMMHLPALTITKQIERIIPAIWAFRFGRSGKLR